MVSVDRRLLVVGSLLFIAVVSGIVVAATVTIYDSGRFQTDSGLVVYGAGDVQVQDGNPFGSATSVTIGGVEFNGSSAEARIDVTDTNGWTNLSQIQAQSGRVGVIRPTTTSEVAVSGTVDSVSVSDLNVQNSDPQTDVVATAGGDWSLRVSDTGLAQGDGIVVRDVETGEIYDVATVQSDGSAHFDELTAVSGQKLDIETGPGELFIYKAAQPDQLVDGVTLTIRAFDHEGQVFERTVSDGTADLTGIPKDQPLTITVTEDQTTDYVYRRTVIESIGQQQEVYLLDSSATNTANVIFELDDRTGDYPPADTILYVQRPITKDFDGDGTVETRYQNVVGDTFGAGTFPTILETNQRYRLIVQNRDGQQRVIGSYTAQLDDRAVIRLTGIEIPVGGDEGYSARMTTFGEDTDGDGTTEYFVRFMYRDPAKKTESLSWTLTSDRTNGTIVQGQTTGPLGRYVVTAEVSNSTEETSYQIEWEGRREADDGTDEQIGGTVWGGDVPDIPIPMDPEWLTYLGWVAIIAVAGLVVIIDSALAGAAATVLAGLLTAIGIVSIPMPALGLAGVVSLVALIGRGR